MLQWQSANRILVQLICYKLRESSDRRLGTRHGSPGKARGEGPVRAQPLLPVHWLEVHKATLKTCGALPGEGLVRLLQPTNHFFHILHVIL